MQTNLRTDMQDEAPSVLEQGDPNSESRAFRRALSQFATGVTVVCAQAGGRLTAMTANSFSSVSLAPPLILWSLAKSAQSVPIFLEASHFTVNVLSSEQVELASHFASSGGDKFAGIDWSPGRGGAPLLGGVVASFECRTHSNVDAGDHIIILGEVEHFKRYARSILLFAHGRFGLAVDYPAPSPVDAVLEVDGQEIDDTMLGLLWDAFSSMSNAFQAQRDAEGMSINQGRVLSLIQRFPGSGMEFIANKSFVGMRTAEDAVSVLMNLGFAQRTSANTYEVTPTGLERVMSLRRRAVAFEAQELSHLSKEDLEAARRVLKGLRHRPA